jgi:hypothetical protein
LGLADWRGAGTWNFKNFVAGEAGTPIDGFLLTASSQIGQVMYATCSFSQQANSECRQHLIFPSGFVNQESGHLSIHQALKLLANSDVFCAAVQAYAA